MISHPPRFLLLRPLPVGKALDLFVSLPYALPLELEDGVDRPIGVLILRKAASVGPISGPDDSEATILYNGIPDGLAMTKPAVAVANPSYETGYGTFHFRDYDSKNLINGSTYEYAIWTMSTETLAGGTLFSTVDEEDDTPLLDSAIIGYRLAPSETDWGALIEERLQYGLATMIGVSQLQTDSENTAPQVFEGYVIGENTKFPIVTFHLSGYTPQEKAIGESIYYGRKTVSGDGDRAFRSRDGRVVQRNYDITVWSLNRVMRNRIGSAVRYLLQANHPVWTGAGATAFDVSAHDDQGLLEPINQTCWMHRITFTVTAPVIVDLVQDPIIRDIDVEIIDRYQNRIVC